MVDLEEDRKKDEKIKTLTDSLVEKDRVIQLLIEEMETKDKNIKSLEETKDENIKSLEEMLREEINKRQEMEEENVVDEKDRTWSGITSGIFDGIGGKFGGWFTHLVQGEEKGEEKEGEEKPVEKKKKRLNQVVTKLSQKLDEPQAGPSGVQRQQESEAEPQPGPSGVQRHQEAEEAGPSRRRSQGRKSEASRDQRKLELEEEKQKLESEKKRVEEAQDEFDRKLVDGVWVGQTVEITAMKTVEDEEETGPARKKRKISKIEGQQKNKPGPKAREEIPLNERWQQIMTVENEKSFVCLNCKHQGKVEKNKYTHNSRPAANYHCKRCIAFVRLGLWPYGYKMPKSKKRSH